MDDEPTRRDPPSPPAPTPALSGTSSRPPKSGTSPTPSPPAPPPSPPPPAATAPQETSSATSVHPSAGSRGSGSSWRSPGAIVGLLILGVVVSLAIVNLVVSRSVERTDTYGGVTAIQLDLDNSSVALVTTDDVTTVHQDVRSGLFGGEVQGEIRDGVLILQLSCPGWGFFPFGAGCGGSVEVFVPVDVPVTGSTSNGGITIDGLAAPVDVSTSNGAIELIGTMSTMNVRTSNGRITGTEVASPMVSARTSNGQVTLTFAITLEQVEVDTSNGSIVLEVPDDGVALHVDAATSERSNENMQ